VILAVLIGTTTLGLVMTVYLVGLAMRRRHRFACCTLALAFALISLSAALLAVHLIHDVPVLVRVRALLALIAVPCLFLYFNALGTERSVPSTRDLVHVLPVAAGSVAVAARMSWLLDGMLAVTYLVYLSGLIRMWKDRASRFNALGDNARQTVSWLQTVMCFLAATLILDVIIAVDLANGGYLKQSAPLLLSIVSLVVMVAFSLIGALGRPSMFEHLHSLSAEADTSSRRRPDGLPDAALQTLAERALLALMDPQVLADDGLTLARLARRLRVPSRQLSQAINRVHGRSFSDLLNDQRIRLCRQIMAEEPDRPLIDVMLDAGYITKSNFYRQFSKRTGLTPAAYRAQLRGGTRSDAE